MSGDEFNREEYVQCWGLLLENIRAIERNELYSIGAIAGVMAFSISLKNPMLAMASSAITLFISYLGRMRYFGFGVTAGALNEYILSVEGSADRVGWVGFQRSREVGKRLRDMRFFLWKVIILVSWTFVALLAATHFAALREPKKMLDEKYSTASETAPSSERLEPNPR